MAKDHAQQIKWPMHVFICMLYNYSHMNMHSALHMIFTHLKYIHYSFNIKVGEMRSMSLYLVYMYMAAIYCRLLSDTLIVTSTFATCLCLQSMYMRITAPAP